MSWGVILKGNMSDLAKRFPFIVRWHRESGSYDYYIDNLLAMAEKENAPGNSIYKGDEGWQTTDHICNLEIRKRWGLEMRECDVRREECNHLRDELHHLINFKDDPAMLGKLIEVAKSYG